MVNRRTLGTAKATFRSTPVLATTVALLWLAAIGYSQGALLAPCSNTGCQHMCTLTKDMGRMSKDIFDFFPYKCVCNMGYQLAEDEHSCVFTDAILLYSQAASIKGKVLKNLSEGYTEVILPVLTGSNGYVGLDFDSHDNYIYYSDVIEKSVIYRIHINGKVRETLLYSKGENVVDLSIDWVTKDLYYIDEYRGTLNVVSTRNLTNKRVLLQDKFIKRLVVHPNKEYIFFSGKGVSRVNMDGSNWINYKYPEFYWRKGLAIDFATDRLYWCEQYTNLIYHSNLDLTDVITIKSEWIHNPRLIATHKDWMFIINNSGKHSLIKLHKLTGALADIELPRRNNEYPYTNLKIYSEHKQRIDNMDPCSKAANNGGCQKLCFAVPSNKSITSSPQALCGCPVGEKVDSDGKTCVVESKATIDSNTVINSNVVVDSNPVVDSNAVVVPVSGGASRNIQYTYVTTVCFVLVFLYTI